LRNGAFAPDLATLKNANRSSAVFGCYAFPITTSGVGTTGTRRFRTTEVGVMRDDTTIAKTPNTRALINGMGVSWKLS
jgi:hypothetical protein